ncbi:CHAT domain-containing protein, partial [Bacteroidota bacterium]|nr:CHAT domain-containing protein [Bacteroidota bacterium]
TVYYTALIIDENAKDYPELVVLEKGTQLEQSGFKYYSLFSSGRNKQRLDEYSYQNYWSPIAEKLKGKKRIYVSSDGVYNKINLNVLYNKEAGKYLGEEIDIRLVSSGRDLFKTYQESNEELTAVLIGSPKYDLIEEQLEDDDLLVSRDLQQNWIDSLSRGWSVSSLPGTAIEVSNISNLMSKNNWEVTTYTEEEALEGKVKSVSSPTVLHIATHGYFFKDVNNGEESPIRIMGIDSKKATQNPLLRSGLLFAGAMNTLNGNPQQSGDNGLLTSYEASYMDLRGTELVVLSACNTARGEIKNGEGVYGLQRAIQQAGAKNIIMSMWKVDDKVTQEFMTTFYEKWLGGESMRNAFNQTQQQIKEKYKHPYYWGAFVMIGR